MEILNGLLVPNAGTIFTALGIFVRMSVFAILLPGLGEVSISIRIRLLVALVMTWIVFPVVLVENRLDQMAIADITTLFIAELIYGFMLGFSLRVMIYVLQIAGTIIAQAMSLSQVLGAGLTEEPNTTVSSLLLLAGTTLVVTLDLHIEAIRLFIQSYEMFPFGSLPDLDMIAHWATEKSVWAFAFALSLSLPFVILNFIYNVALGMISRAMPQLMVSFVGMPAITGASIILLALSIGALLSFWLINFDSAFLDFGVLAP